MRLNGRQCVIVRVTVHPMTAVSANNFKIIIRTQTIHAHITIERCKLTLLFALKTRLHNINVRCCVIHTRFPHEKKKVRRK
jgi:hypothetical protein